MTTRPVTIIDDGVTKLWGLNVGPYPLHHFHTRPITEPLPLNIKSCGWDDWVKGCERRRANSSNFAIEYVREGNFEFEQDGRFHLVKPDEVFIVHLGATTMMRTPEEMARKRVIELSGACLDLIVNACGLSNIDVIGNVDTSLLDALFEEAEQLITNAPPGFARRASTVAYEVLLALGDALGRRKLPPAVGKALELFERRIYGRLTMKELSAYCSCSAVTLERQFRNSFGETPMERFLGMKMEMAKSLLTMSAEPVKEVARRLGYSNQLYFSSEFRKRVGVSPRDFRKDPGKAAAKR